MMFLGRLAIACALALSVATTARADEAPPPEPDKPSSFGAGETPAELPEVAPGDFEGLLRNCDVERTRAANAAKLCEKDKANIPFLTAAYLALWAILLVFFGIVAMRQKRMAAEMAMLRERLARLGDDGS